MDDRDGEHELAQEAAERTFAILTATYHGLPERETLIAELGDDEARAVVKLMSALLPEVVERLRRETPWLH